METLNPVNAEAVVNVEPQTEVNAPIAPVESVSTEVASEQPVKEVQSKEDNAKYAEVRREAERKAEDRVYSQLYGDSHGIHTKADYERAVREQRESEMIEQLRQDDADPSVIKEQLYKEWENNDPRLKEYEKIVVEHSIQKQIAELNADLKADGIDGINSLAEIAKLKGYDEVVKLYEQGLTLSQAYFLANKSYIIESKATKIQQDTIQKLQANGEASTGSLANNGQTTQLYTRDQVDAMSQAEVNKNYDLVMKSAKTWK